jgi:superfamily II DNA/RNA helicase
LPPHARRPASTRPHRGRSHRPARPAPAAPPPLATRAPRPAVTSFAAAGLPAKLVTTLERRGMHAPFAIQGATLPDALAGEHLLARAQTGAGKTLGFGLPVLGRLAAGEGKQVKRSPRALVLVPTRELAQQVADAMRPLAQPLDLSVAVVYGGTSIGKQAAVLDRGVDLLIATPGRLEDLMARGICKLDQVRITVLDEADHMCDLGFLPVMKRLLAQVPADGQRLLFSATLDGAVDELVREFLPDPVLVAIDPEVGPVATLEHHAFEAAHRDAKVELVTALASGAGRTLLFTRTKHGADRLAKQLRNSRVAAAALHGGMAQGARTRTLKGFAEGTHRVLVATDVAARGVHVDGIDLVVHADPPAEHKAYLHRSGRTARAGASGAVVTVSLPEQRREVETLLRLAGAGIRPVAVGADDPRVRELVGPLAPPAEPQRPTQQPVAAKPATERPQGQRPHRRPAGSGRPQARRSGGGRRQRPA